MMNTLTFMATSQPHHHRCHNLMMVTICDDGDDCDDGGDGDDDGDDDESLMMFV